MLKEVSDFKYLGARLGSTEKDLRKDGGAESTQELATYTVNEMTGDADGELVSKRH